MEGGKKDRRGGEERKVEGGKEDRKGGEEGEGMNVKMLILIEWSDLRV